MDVFQNSSKFSLGLILRNRQLFSGIPSDSYELTALHVAGPHLQSDGNSLGSKGGSEDGTRVTPAEHSVGKGRLTVVSVRHRVLSCVTGLNYCTIYTTNANLLLPTPYIDYFMALLTISHKNTENKACTNSRKKLVMFLSCYRDLFQ